MISDNDNAREEREKQRKELVVKVATLQFTCNFKSTGIPRTDSHMRVTRVTPAEQWKRK